MNEQEKLPVLVFKLPTKEMSSNSFSLGNIAHNKESKRKIPRNKSSPKTIKPLIPLEHCIQITLDKNVILLVVKDTKYDYL